MSKYEVGDRVKLSAEYLNPYKGTVMQVQSFDDGSPNEYHIQLDDRNSPGAFFATELAALTEEEI